MRSRHLRALLPAALLAAAAACASTLPPVRVDAAPADLTRMAGEWRGEYAGRGSGRSGSILFRLAADADSAYGDVVMVPRQGVPSRPTTARPQAPAPASARALTIRFVRIADGRVSGALDRYEDPECACTVVTRFEGRVSGDRVEGTYTTQGGAHTVEGRWSATRAW